MSFCHAPRKWGVIVSENETGPDVVPFFEFAKVRYKT